MVSQASAQSIPAGMETAHEDNRWRQFFRRVRRQKLMMLGLYIFAAITIVVLFPNFFATHDPLAIDVPNKQAPPSVEHWFGTDELGRDIYSRVIHGMRLSFTAGFVVVFGGMILGTGLGMIAGYAGNLADDVLMRLSDVFLAFPGLVMAMAFVTALGPGLRNAMLALIVIWWPQYARLARGMVLSVKHHEYIEGARAIGAGDVRILTRYILPNIFPTIFVKATLDLGLAILVTAALSFLGLGAQPPQPELGAMVTAGRSFLLTSWWYSTFPGLIIFIGVLATNLVGDGLRDVLDPTLTGN